MLMLINFELYKIFKKWRSYIAFLAIGVLISIIHISLYISGEKFIQHTIGNLNEMFIFTGNLLNGNFTAYYILFALIVHVPFLITIVAGDIFAGEATAGTYRVLLTRPVSRFTIVTSKFLASNLYTLIFIGWIALLSWGLGIIIFGNGELIVMKDSLLIFSKDQAYLRIIAAYLLGFLSMSVVTSLAFAFSSFVENSIGPIFATMSVIIIFLIFQNIDLEFFKNIKPFLFTNYMQVWSNVFTEPIEIDKILKSCAVLTIHIFFFYFVTLFSFLRKDFQS